MPAYSTDLGPASTGFAKAAKQRDLPEQTTLPDLHSMTLNRAPITNTVQGGTHCFFTTMPGPVRALPPRITASKYMTTGVPQNHPAQTTTHHCPHMTQIARMRAGDHKHPPLRCTAWAFPVLTQPPPHLNRPQLTTCAQPLLLVGAQLPGLPPCVRHAQLSHGAEHPSCPTEARSIYLHRCSALHQQVACPVWPAVQLLCKACAAASSVQNTAAHVGSCHLTNQRN